MSEEITVKVHSYGPNRPLSLVYFDPISGKKKAKSSGTTNWREAERLAGELEKELRSGHTPPRPRSLGSNSSSGTRTRSCLRSGPGLSKPPWNRSASWQDSTSPTGWPRSTPPS